MVGMTGLARTMAARFGRLGESHYVRSVGALMSGTIGAQAIGFGAMLVLARLYSPSDFGAFAFFATVVGLLALLSTGKYDQAVFVARSGEEARALTALGALLAAGSAIATYLIALAIDAALTRQGFANFLAGREPLLALAVASGGGLNALNAFGVQSGHFAIVSRSRLAQAVTAAAAGIGLGLAGQGAGGLILAFVLGQIVATLYLAARLPSPLSRPQWSELAAKARAHSRFPRYLLLSELFNYAGNNLIAFVTPGHFGFAQLGQFNLGQRVATLPITVIGGAMGEVFRSSISPQNADASRVEALFRENARRLAAIGLVLTLPLLIAGPQLFEALFGAKWREAGLYVQVLSPVIFARFVVSPLSAVLLITGKQRMDTFLQILFVTAAAVAVLSVIYLGDFYLMILIMAVLQAFIYGIYFWISREASRKVRRS